MTDIQIFKNERFGEVRVAENEKGEPIFCLADMCKVLDLTNPSAVKNRLDVEDVQMIDLHALNYEMAGNSMATFINETGFYEVLLFSSSPKVKPFRRWVTAEVLPTMRKTGGYVANEALFVDTYLPYADDATKEMFRASLATVRKQNELIARQRKEIEYKEDIIIGLVDDISLSDKRQILNRVVKHKGADFQERWKVLYREFESKYHINLKARFDRHNQENKPKLKNKLDYIDIVMGKVPELYELAAKMFENDVKELVDEMYNLCKKVA